MSQLKRWMDANATMRKEKFAQNSQSKSPRKRRCTETKRRKGHPSTGISCHPSSLMQPREPEGWIHQCLLLCVSPPPALLGMILVCSAFGCYQHREVAVTSVTWSKRDVRINGSRRRMVNGQYHGIQVQDACLTAQLSVWERRLRYGSRLNQSFAPYSTPEWAVARRVRMELYEENGVADVAYVTCITLPDLHPDRTLLCRVNREVAGEWEYDTRETHGIFHVPFDFQLLLGSRLITATVGSATSHNPSTDARVIRTIISGLLFAPPMHTLSRTE